MLRAPANFGFLPVERKQVSDDPGIDTPMFDWAWSDSSATTGMASVSVRSHRRRFGRAWDYYDIFYAIPDRPISPNEALRAIPRIPSFWGDIIVVRRDPKGVRLLDMRDRDVPKVTSAVRMCVSLLPSSWRSH